jgi:hypothetical protein
LGSSWACRPNSKAIVNFEKTYEWPFDKKNLMRPPMMPVFRKRSLRYSHCRTRPWKALGEVIIICRPTTTLSNIRMTYTPQVLQEAFGKDTAPTEEMNYFKPLAICADPNPLRIGSISMTSKIGKSINPGIWILENAPKFSNRLVGFSTARRLYYGGCDVFSHVIRQFSAFVFVHSSLSSDIFFPTFLSFSCSM